jgi:hypothetical protein
LAYLMSLQHISRYSEFWKFFTFPLRHFALN